MAVVNSIKNMQAEKIAKKADNNVKNQNNNEVQQSNNQQNPFSNDTQEKSNDTSLFSLKSGNLLNNPSSISKVEAGDCYILDALNDLAESNLEDSETEAVQESEAQNVDDDSNDNELKASILNEDGSLNADNIVNMYQNGELTFDELVEALNATPNDISDRIQTYTTQDGLTLRLSDTKHTIFGTEDDNGTVRYDREFNYTDYLEILDADGNLVLGSATQDDLEAVSNIQNEINAQNEANAKAQAEEQARLNDLAHTYFNEDGSVNLSELENAITSGNLTVYDFLEICTDSPDSPVDSNAIGYTRSNTFYFTLPDGTQVEGTASDLGQTQTFLYFVMPDGSEHEIIQP